MKGIRPAKEQPPCAAPPDALPRENSVPRSLFTPVVAPLREFRLSLSVLSPQSRHPVLATLMGLALVAVLVPILGLANGANGPLGQSIPLFFLVPVLLSSAVGGRLPGVLVSCVAIAVWDWFFIQPLYTVTIASVRDILALVVFLAVALLVGQLSTATRRRTEEALRRARSSEALYELSVALIARVDLTDALTALTARLHETFDLEACAVLLPDPGQPGRWNAIALAGCLPASLNAERSRAISSLASWSNTNGEKSGIKDQRPLGSPMVRGEQLDSAGPRAEFLPLRVGVRAIGVLEVVYKANALPDPDRDHLLATFANGVALALEQERLAHEERAAELARESDSLKSALLSSVSHDLRTPLATIKAAATSLLQDDVAWSEDDRRSFVIDIDAEADRLTRLVSNLLDLSRIEAGAITPEREWDDVGELIERVIRRMGSQLADHPISSDISPYLPPLRFDAVYIEQALTNLLENAAKYSRPGEIIEVSCGVTRVAGSAELFVAVRDRGSGIAHSELNRIFEKFYRVGGVRRGGASTGMGLAIVKGLIEAHGGRVVAESVLGQGSTFTFFLPLDETIMPNRAASGAHPVAAAKRS